MNPIVVGIVNPVNVSHLRFPSKTISNHKAPVSVLGSSSDWNQTNPVLSNKTLL